MLSLKIYDVVDIMEMHVCIFFFCNCLEGDIRVTTSFEKNLNLSVKYEKKKRRDETGRCSWKCCVKEL